jgi:hypothetical protein
MLGRWTRHCASQRVLDVLRRAQFWRPPLFECGTVRTGADDQRGSHFQGGQPATCRRADRCRPWLVGWLAIHQRMPQPAKRASETKSEVSRRMMDARPPDGIFGIFTGLSAAGVADVSGLALHRQLKRACNLTPLLPPVSCDGALGRSFLLASVCRSVPACACQHLILKVSQAPVPLR